VGLRIDPVKKRLKISHMYRPNAVHYNVAISDVEKLDCFYIDDKDMWHREAAGNSTQYVVRCVTLQRILDEWG